MGVWLVAAVIAVFSTPHVSWLRVLADILLRSLGEGHGCVLGAQASADVSSVSKIPSLEAAVLALVTFVLAANGHLVTRSEDPESVRGAVVQSGT